MRNIKDSVEDIVEGLGEFTDCDYNKDPVKFFWSILSKLKEQKEDVTRFRETLKPFAQVGMVVELDYENRPPVVRHNGSSMQISDDSYVWITALQCYEHRMVEYDVERDFHHVRGEAVRLNYDYEPIPPEAKPENRLIRSK